MKKFINKSLPNLSGCPPVCSSPLLYHSLNIENHLEEITIMTKKALFIFAAVVLTVLFSFQIFAQEKGQEATEKASEKVVTYNDLLEQKKAIEGLKVNYSKITAEYNAECKEKTYKTINEYPKEECDKKYAQVTKAYSELKKEVDSFNKNAEKYQAGAKGK
jgi:hypothetical protein